MKRDSTIKKDGTLSMVFDSTMKSKKLKAVSEPQLSLDDSLRETNKKKINSRAKGNRFENLIVGHFQDLYSDLNSKCKTERIRRGNQKRFGHDDSDVKTPHFWVECKHGKRTNIKKALSQSVNTMKKKGLSLIPIAVTRDNNMPILVTMSLAHFKKIVSSGVDLEIPDDWQ